VKYLTRKSIECEEREITMAIEELAREYASYEGDPIDDYREYVDKFGDKCVIIMTPVGELLIFEVRGYEGGIYIVKLIASSWGEL